MKWKPISTAPKDTRILLSYPSGRIVCGQWYESRYLTPIVPYWRTDQGDRLGRRMERLNPPTHWMPLPDPPKEML